TDGQVEYGPTITYGSVSTFDASLQPKHLITITGLTPGTTYHYRVNSKNSQGIAATSGDFTFTTYAAPVISNVAASAITATSATISWTNDINSNSFVEYGQTAPHYGDATNPTEEFVTVHAQGIFNLDPGTLYHFRVYSTTPQGVITQSGDFTF